MHRLSRQMIVLHALLALTLCGCASPDDYLNEYPGLSAIVYIVVFLLAIVASLAAGEVGFRGARAAGRSGRQCSRSRWRTSGLAFLVLSVIIIFLILAGR